MRMGHRYSYLRLLLVCGLFSVFVSGLNAQNQRPGINRAYVPDAVEQGNILINGGVGFFSVFASNQLAGYRAEIPPLYLCGEYAISDGMTAGAYFAYSTFNQTAQNAKITAILAGPRLSYRLYVNESVDVYASLLFGIVGLSAKSIDTNRPLQLQQSYAPFYGTMVGARYFFTQNLGVNAEIGWGLTLVNLGITYKIANQSSAK